MKQRLDAYMQINNLCKSRTTAQNLIKNKKVLVNKKICESTSFKVDENDLIEIIENEKYVSRGAYKLLGALDKFNIDVENKICLDIGSSTGGFTQVLWERKAKQIFSLDVGTNQLHESLKEKENIIALEQTNFKDVTNKTFNDQKINLITCDVSFISARKIINKLNELKWDNFEFILLFKPQFEVGKQEISKHKGLVKNEIVKEKVLNDFIDFCNQNNFNVVNKIISPIKGAKMQNEEFLIFLRK